MHRTIAVFICAVIPSLGQAQTPTGPPISTAGASSVTVINALGYVRIEGWNLDSVSAVGAESDSVTIRREATGEIRIYPRRDKAGGNFSRSDIFVRVPRNIRVNVEGHLTKVDVSGLTGRVAVSAGVQGDIKISGILDEVNVDAAYSDIELHVTSPYVRAKSASGRIRWTGSSADVLLSTVTGGITIQAGTIGRGRFESTSGDIHFLGGLTGRASVAFETHSGDITAEFAKGTTAEVIVSGPVTDLFGLHGTSTLDQAARGGVVQVLGGKTDATVTLRSFKGKVTAAIQP